MSGLETIDDRSLPNEQPGSVDCLQITGVPVDVCL